MQAGNSKKMSWIRSLAYKSSKNNTINYLDYFWYRIQNKVELSHLNVKAALFRSVSTVSECESKFVGIDKDEYKRLIRVLF